MDKNVPLHLQDIIFSSSDKAISRTISILLKEGKIRKIAPRIYTPQLDGDPADIIRPHIFRIIGHLFPGILLSHRSALEYRPTSTGDLFLTYTYSRNVKLPGITLNIMKGVGAIAGDNLFTEGLYVSQSERAILENLQESRRPGPQSKVLPLLQIEERLEQIVVAKGEEGLNALRDKARTIGQSVGMEKEFEKLDKLIGALLATKPSGILTSPVAMARAFGHPYDSERISLFETLFVELQNRVFSEVPERNLTATAFRNVAFFESYFSNYIEGTKFEVEEALKIIETGKPMPTRDEDSHDVLGTYQVVSNRMEMSITPERADQLLDILRYRHKVMLSGRPSKNPGEFKDRNNRAGNTEFVDFSLVRGTLIRGFEFYRAIEDPFAKAAFMMFMVSEVHPFLDGNGRVARVMMNAELVKAQQTKIIIPTVFRTDYLGALRQLTRRRLPDTYIRMLQRAQLFSATLIGENVEVMQDVLTKSNAFEEGDDYILRIVAP